MRKLISVLCAALLAMSLVITAAAYPQSPGYSQPKADEKTAVNDSVVTDAIANATGDTIIIDITKDAAIDTSALAAIAAQDKPVVFVAEGFSIIILPGDIGDNAKGINLSMAITTANGKIEIVPSAKGDFGFAFTIVIPAANINSSGLKTSALKAYYVDDSGKVTKKLPSKLNDNGSFSLKVSHASSYIITDQTLATTGGNTGTADLSDDDELGDDDFDDDDFGVDGDSNTPEGTNAGGGANQDGSSNPFTGVTISFVAAGAAGLVAFASKKSKK